MSNTQPNNPLHGITLKVIVERLVDYYGWEQLGLFIEINCFNYKPSLTSSLRFLRKTPWARAKVERLYIIMQDRIEADQQGHNEPEPTHCCPNSTVEPLDSAESQSSSSSNVSQELSRLTEAEGQTVSKGFKFEYRAKKSPD